MNQILEDFKGELQSVPLTAPFVDQIEKLQHRYGTEYENVAVSLLSMLPKLGFETKKVSRRYIFDYLKQLDYFLKYGNYGHADYTKIQREIYDSKETMMDTYMPGLLLSYAYTTILYEKNHIFLNSFLPQIPRGGKGIEIGFGEGFYLWETLAVREDLTLHGFDISNHAVCFADKLLKLNHINKNRFKLNYGNIFEGIEIESESRDFGILAEVIEHIPNPEVGVREMARILKENALFYLTTVINSNHMDHISNFPSPEAVETILKNEGFEIQTAKVYQMTEDFPESKDMSIGLAYVAKRRA